MSDPFQEAHRRQAANSDKALKDAQRKAATQQIQQRIATTQKNAEKPANWDVGYPFPKKFYEYRS